ncbi:branched-chain amino acid ABC transporter substrate-binding protein [Sphaerisporangium krabiense]|uniref:Branched-chain amino acid transport system substrate-binding protein n=1 Tax=Sphaerisporangium krabiense TaxID=763782 RepID=A0A7W8Z8Z7_9ACTN|nr:ABC transporter substrate-binding protein [Sphaerisporangium krabiense]MBB5629546.1 branched-chain amino acid transport system substrate-binding protein [Sphaerisporangium krabiense]GII65600.1 branched-chain amino acid ABC transporter substrate-binding protein [Sphaerisporangium krabiense]
MLRATRLAVLAAGLLLAVTACGGGADESGSPPVAKDQVKCGLGNGQKATGKPITVGAIVTASGGIDFSSAPKAARAYFDCVNANGGVNGRPISYIVEDDGLNPQKASELATKLAGNADLVGIVGGSSFVACGVSGPIWEKNGLYDLLATGVPRPCFESPRIAPVNAGPRISAIGSVQYAVEVFGAKKVAQISNSVPGTGDWTQAGVDAYLKSKGLTTAGNVLHDPGIKDAPAVLLQAMRGEPDTIVMEDPAPDNAAIMKAAQAQGLKDKVHFVCLTPCYDTTFPKQVGGYWDGFVSNSEFTMLDATTPDNQLWRKVMDAYGDPKDPRDSFSQGGFLSAKIFVDTIMKLKGDLTRDEVSKAVVGIKGYKSDILCAPWYFGEAPRHNANHVTRQVKMQGDGYALVRDCADTQDPDLGPIRAAEKAQGLLTSD